MLENPQHKEATRNRNRPQRVYPGEAEGTELKERGSDMQSQAEAALTRDTPESRQQGKLQVQFLRLATDKTLQTCQGI